jgi:hypothetical protein
MTLTFSLVFHRRCVFIYFQYDWSWETILKLHSFLCLCITSMIDENLRLLFDTSNVSLFRWFRLLLTVRVGILVSNWCSDWMRNHRIFSHMIKFMFAKKWTWMLTQFVRQIDNWIWFELYNENVQKNKKKQNDDDNYDSVVCLVLNCRHILMTKKEKRNLSTHLKITYMHSLTNHSSNLLKTYNTICCVSSCAHILVD